jgi:hypothetical protein
MKIYYITKHSIISLCALFSVGCASRISMTSVPGASLVRDNLADSVISNIGEAEEISAMQGAQGINGGHPHLVQTEIVTPKKNGKWVEAWVIQRDGYLVKYTIPFADSADGQTSFKVINNPTRL